MKNSVKKYLYIICVLWAVYGSAPLWAKDFGIILDQTVDFGGAGKETNIDYEGLLIPRLAVPVGDNGGFFISAAAHVTNDPWSLAPELLRTDFYWRFNSGEFRMGRMLYSDPLGFTAAGLFDGARVSLDTRGGTFSLGAWYTGLLYKKRANITMTVKELQSNLEDLDYSDFSNTYFAPRRIVAALDWEHPAIGELLRAQVSILGQYDLSDGDKLHSQYALAKFSLPVNDFLFSLGGGLELTEVTDEDTGIAMAGDLGIAWMLPTALQDRLSLLGRFSSGVIKDSSVVAFNPITTQSQGDILQARLSGLSLVSLDYLAQPIKSLSFGITSTYFVRSDLGTYQDYGADGYFLGSEFYGRLIWSPLSDVQVNLGGGAFLPSLGNAAPDAKALWQVELNVVLSLY